MTDPSPGHDCTRLCTARTCKCPPCGCEDCLDRAARAAGGRTSLPTVKPNRPEPKFEPVQLAFTLEEAA